MLDPQQKAALARFAPACLDAQAQSALSLGVPYPARAIIAQWAAETGWSLSKVTGDWNLFGLTAANFPDRPKKFCPTSEVLTLAQFERLPADERDSVTGRKDLGAGKYRYSLSRWFTSFPSLAEGILGYVHVITIAGHRYEAAWKRYCGDRELDALLEGIAAAGYASGEGYASLLKNIVRMPEVEAALRA